MSKPRSRTAGWQMYVSWYNTLPNYFPKWLYLYTFPPATCDSSSCSSHTNTCYSQFLKILAILITSFLFPFPWWLMMLSIFSCAYLPSLGKCMFRSRLYNFFLDTNSLKNIILYGCTSLHYWNVRACLQQDLEGTDDSLVFITLAKMDTAALIQGRNMVLVLGAAKAA